MDSLISCGSLVFIQIHVLTNASLWMNLTKSPGGPGSAWCWTHPIINRVECRVCHVSRIVLCRACDVCVWMLWSIIGGRTWKGPCFTTRCLRVGLHAVRALSTCICLWCHKWECPPRPALQLVRSTIRVTVRTWSVHNTTGWTFAHHTWPESELAYDGTAIGKSHWLMQNSVQSQSQGLGWPKC